ncbi:MAG TPA: WD40 repeat domain-containing protein, partial [Planctomycetaceae bacterium]|nr:WD40 repeat domain-containing protein [Planctomycetaceae bacterium]
DPRTGASKKSIDEAPNFAQRLAWSANGRLATAGTRLRIWDGEALHEQWRSPDLPSPIGGIGWAADDRVVMTSQAGLRLYHSDGELLATAPPVGRSQYGRPALLELDDSGNGWWNGRDWTLPVLGWNLRNGQPIGSVPEARWYRVSPNGEWLVDWVPPARLFETRTGTLKRQFDIPQQSDEAAWSHDSRFLAFARTDGAVEIRDIAGGAAVGEFRAPDRTWRFRHVKYSPDDQRIAAESDGPGKLVVWDVKSKEVLWQSDAPGGNFEWSGSAFDWSPDGAELAAWKVDGSIARLDAGTGKPRAAALPVRPAARELRYSPDGKYLAATESEATAVIELATAQEFRLPYAGVIRWMPGTQILMLTPWNRDSEIIAYDVGRRRYEGTLLPLIDNKDHLCIGPDGHYRGSPGIEQHLVYIAEHEDGRLETYSPADFVRRFGWQNNPERAGLISEE